MDRLNENNSSKRLGTERLFGKENNPRDVNLAAELLKRSAFSSLRETVNRIQSYADSLSEGEERDSAIELLTNLKTIIRAHRANKKIIVGEHALMNDIKRLVL